MFQIMFSGVTTRRSHVIRPGVSANATRRRPSSSLAATATLALAAIIGLGSGTASAQVTWTGTSSDWSLNTNWTPTTTLANSGTYSLVFAGTPTALSSTNALTNLVLGTGSTNAIRFDTSGFTLGGNAITLSSTIANLAASGTNAINFNMSVGAVRTISGTAGSTTVLGGNISGAGGLTLSRAGSGIANFVLSGSNDFTGGISINTSSSLTITSTNALGRNVASNKITLGGNTATLTNQAGSFVLQNNVDYNTSGGAATINVGAGNNLTIDGTTTFINGNGGNGLTVGSGTLTVRTWAGQNVTALPGLGGGVMVVKEDAQADFTKGFIINSGTLLMGAANALGTGTVQLKGGLLATTRDLTLSMPLSGSSGSMGGAFNVTVSSTIGGTSFSKVGTGTLTLSANNTFAGTVTASAGELVLNGLNTGGATLSGSTARLVLGNSNAIGGTLTLTNGTLANVAGVTTLGGNRPIALGAGSGTITFAGPADLNLGSGTVAIGASAVTFNVTSNVLRLDGNLTNATNNSSFTKTGGGVLVIGGTNLATGSNGNIDIKGGVLRIDTPQSLPGGSGTSGNIMGVRLYDGVLGLGFTSGTFTRALASANTGINFALATGTAGFAGYGSSTQSVNISGTGAPLQFGGSGASTYFFRSGTAFGFGAPDATQAVEFQNPLDLNNAEQKFVAIRGQVDLVGVLSGVVSNGSLRKDGLGTLALAAANTYTGTTTISAGTLQIGNSGTAGSISNSSPVNVSSGAGLAFFRSDDFTYSGTVSGAGNLTKLGAATLSLTSTHTYTGTTTISTGTLQIGNGGATGLISNSSPVSVASGAALAFNRSNAVLYSGTVSGSGGLTKLGASTLTLDAAQAYTGATTITTGTLQIGNGSATGSIQNSSPVSVASGAALAFNRSDAFTYSGIVSGSGGLAKLGASTLTLDTVQAYTGATTITTGTLQIGNNGTTGAIQTSSPVSVASGAALAFYRSDDLTYSGSVSGAGGLVKRGASKLTLDTTQAYTGATSVSEGTLVVNGSILASSGVSVVSGATLGGSGAVSAISGAGLVSPGNSPGILTATSAELSSGLDFAFEFTQAGEPTWSSATASGNDLLRLTNTNTPIIGTAGSGNVFNIYFAAIGQTYLGGLFTDKTSSFESTISGATFNYFVQDVSGTTLFNGTAYAALEAGQVTRSTVQVGSATFSGGTVNNGYTMQFVVVPEPQTLVLLGIGAAGIGWSIARRRRSA